MCVGSPTAGAWSSFQRRPDDEFETDRFVRSVLALMGADLNAPDHPTLSRRSQQLVVVLRRIPAQGPIHLIVESTGLSIVGQGAWAVAKHGGHGKRGWKTLHLGVDRSGVIVAPAFTDAHVDDVTTAVDLIPVVDVKISPVTADAASATASRSRSYRQAGAGGRTAAREEGGGLPSAGARGECLLPVHVDHRRGPSRAECSRAGG